MGLDIIIRDAYGKFVVAARVHYLTGCFHVVEGEGYEYLWGFVLDQTTEFE